MGVNTMLDAISDFWKPMKKNQAQDKLQPEQLQVGSSIGFGFVPQSSLSGQRLQVSAINTYQFGDETLTSFGLIPEKESTGTTTGVSMIVAESEGEYYLALSRRLTISDRIKLFEANDLENVTDKQDATRLACKEPPAEFKGWLVPNYKREIQALKGRIFSGDFRKGALPAEDKGQEFKYTLLVSESNEHAVEIEQYNDGRMEAYATVYRRMSDIGEISHPDSPRPSLTLASVQAEKPAAPVAPVAVAASAPVENPAAIVPAALAAVAVPAPVEKPAAEAPPAIAPIKLQDFKSFTAIPAPEVKPETKHTAELKPEVKVVPVAEIKPALAEVKPAPVTQATYPVTPKPEEKPAMSFEPATNGAMTNKPAMQAADNKPKLASVVVQPTAPETFLKQEIKTVNKAPTGLEQEAVECDLRVANKIIDEAIRNEMRLSDVVRRIIELPVAYPEAVQIPIALSDEDFALLGIRYGISALDKNAIKRRIAEDLNDFSGKK